MAPNDELTDFIRTYIPSVWSLELLVLLYSDQERWWTSTELLRELRASTSLIDEILARFERQGLVWQDHGKWHFGAANKRANGDHVLAFARYEQVLRQYIALKQRGAKRFAGAIAPKTQLGLCFRNAVIRSMNIPGVAKMAVGREMTDRLTLPKYG